MSLISKVREKTKHGTMLLYISDRLSDFGLKVNLYYIVQEFPLTKKNGEIKPKLDSWQVDFLDASDLKHILSHPENKHYQGSDLVSRWLAENCLCFGIKHENEVAAYVWCNLNSCNENITSFVLKSDEVYIFESRTFKRFRGKNLAPYIRYELYKRLMKMGRTKYYSITNMFNTPSIKFKSKLLIRPLMLCLYVDFFGKFNRNFILKKYRQKHNLKK